MNRRHGGDGKPLDLEVYDLPDPGPFGAFVRTLHLRDSLDVRSDDEGVCLRAGKKDAANPPRLGIAPKLANELAEAPHNRLGEDIGRPIRVVERDVGESFVVHGEERGGGTGGRAFDGAPLVGGLLESRGL